MGAVVGMSQRWILSLVVKCKMLMFVEVILQVFHVQIDWEGRGNFLTLISESVCKIKNINMRKILIEDDAVSICRLLAMNAPRMLLVIELHLRLAHAIPASDPPRSTKPCSCVSM